MTEAKEDGVRSVLVSGGGRVSPRCAIVGKLVCLALGCRGPDGPAFHVSRAEAYRSGCIAREQQVELMAVAVRQEDGTVGAILVVGTLVPP